MPKKPTFDPIKIRRETCEWLEEHTIQDVRAIAKDLENAGEDVSELVDAINDLEAVVRGESTRTSHRGAAKAEA